MVIKVFVSRVSGNMEMKKRQEFIMNLLASKHIEYKEVDISDPTNEEEKMFMREHAEPEEGKKVPLAPQVFNEDEYCGDYLGFHEANECEILYEFLKMETETKNASSTAMTFSEIPDHDSDEENRKPKRDYGDPTLDMLTGQISEDDHVDNDFDKGIYDHDDTDDKQDYNNGDNVGCGGGSDPDEPEQVDEDDGLGDDDQGDEEAVNGDGDN